MYHHIKTFLEFLDKLDLEDSEREKLLSLYVSLYPHTEELERILALKGLEALADIFPKHLKPSTQEIFLGKTSGNGLFIDRELLKRNLLIFGESGAGKTNLILNLMLQFLEKEISFWSFDFKRDYRALLRYADQLGKELIVLRWQNLKFNPLEPPKDVPVEHWAQVFKRIFGHSQGLWIASQAFLGEHLYKLYKLSEPEWPSLFELLEVIKATSPKPGTPSLAYRDRILSRLKDILAFEGPVFDCSTGHIEALISRNVVFELDGLSPQTQSFIVELFLAYLYESFKAEGQTPFLKKVIVFDEAKHLFDVRRRNRIRDARPYIDEIVSLSRAFGIGLVVADQEPSAISNSIKANSAVKVLLQLGSAKDIDEAIKTLGLNREQAKKAYFLQTGEAIVKITGLESVKVKIPLVKIERVRDEEVEKQLEFIGPLPFKPRMQSAKLLSYLAKEIAPKSSTTDPLEESLNALSEDAKKLLISVGNEPLIPLAKRYKLLNFSAYLGNKAKKELIRHNLVYEVEVSLGKGGRPKFLDVTPKGDLLLQALGVVFSLPGKGSFEHKLWQNKIAECLKKKTPHVFVEWQCNNGFLDVFAVDHFGKKIGIEVSLSAKGELEDVKKLLDEELDERWVVCKNEKVLKELKTLASKEFGDKTQKIRFCLLDDFPMAF